MEKIINILPVTVKKLGINRQFTIHSVMAHWCKIVGDEISSHAHPRDIQRSILFVSVDNSVWCHHLSMMKQNIIDKINAFAREKIINDIRFQAGYFQICPNENTDTHENNDIVYNLNKVPLTQQDIHIIQETTEGLEDKYLKRRVMRIMRKDLALRKVKSEYNWKVCAGCSVLCPPGEKYCTACKIQYKEKAIGDIIRMLKEVPWIKCYEVQLHIECSENEFLLAKSRLVASIAQELRHDSMDRLKVMSYIMLTTGAKIEALNDAIINKTMEKFRRKKDVSASGR